MAASSEFAPIIGPLAKHLFGDPNPAFSTKDEWRYGNNGSLAIDIAKGTWYDFEANEGGGVLDLVQREKGVQGQDRIDYLKAKGFLYETLDGGGGSPPTSSEPSSRPTTTPTRTAICYFRSAGSIRRIFASAGRTGQAAGSGASRASGRCHIGSPS